MGRKLLAVAGIGLSLTVLAVTKQVLATPEHMAPVMPTGVTATALSARQIRISWATVDQAAQYKLQRGSSIIANVNGTEYTDTDLTPGSAYTYRVIASNSYGDSPASAYAVATTQASYDNKAPSSPPTPIDQPVTSSPIGMPMPLVSSDPNIKLFLIAGGVGLLLGIGGATLWFQNRRHQAIPKKSIPKNRR